MLNVKLLRGGSWLSFPRDCGSATRVRVEPGSPDDDLGFRVVCLNSSTWEERDGKEWGRCLDPDSSCFIGDNRPVCGGSWNFASWSFRSASRIFHFDDLGFRVVCLPHSQPDARPPSEKELHA